MPPAQALVRAVRLGDERTTQEGLGYTGVIDFTVHRSLGFRLTPV